MLARFSIWRNNKTVYLILTNYELKRVNDVVDQVAKSEGLSMQSKTFYKTAKKTNSCCASWS